MIYLDANASTPVRPEAKEAFLAALELTGNASSPHAMGRAVRRLLDEARVHVATALGGSDKELFFTSGASEGNRWLVDAVVKAGVLRGHPFKVFATPLEHPSLTKPLLEAANSGLILLQDAMDAEVVFATAAHNETGVLGDLESLAATLRPDVILISDAAQAVGRLAPLSSRVDAVVASGHKVGAIAGVGAVLIRGNAKRLPAPWSGGGQEGGVRPGTEAVPLIVAFGAVCAQIDRIREQHQELVPLRDFLEQAFCNAFPNARIVGSEAPRLPNTTAITLANVDGEALRIAIDGTGVCVGFGSACSALAPEPSPSLMTFGLTPQEARATIRFSLHPDLARADISRAIQRLIG